MRINNKDYISTYENLNNILINDNGENIIQKVINIKGLQDNYNIEDIEYIKELNSLDEYENGDKIIISKIKID